MTTLIETIGDRIHAINQTLTGIRAERYFDTNTFQKPPVIVPTVGRVVQTERLYEGFRRITRQWTLTAVVWNMSAGLPSVSAQTRAEALIEVIEDAYDVRDRLQLDGDVPDYVYRALLGDDSGITVREDGLAVIEFPLLVTYDRAVTLT
jgi:hypothetical protein